MKDKMVEKRAKILAIIQDNPEGITLPEIGYIMGLAFVSITKDVNKLLADGLIKKEEGEERNLYFPKK